MEQALGGVEKTRICMLVGTVSRAVEGAVNRKIRVIGGETVGEARIWPLEKAAGEVGGGPVARTVG